MSADNIFGPPGAGKSVACMKLATEHLYKGGVVGMNWWLQDDWAYKMAVNHPLYVNGQVDFETCVQSLQRRCYHIGTHETVNELARMAHDLVVGDLKNQKEHKTRVFIDEAQLFLNTRNFRENWGWVECCSQHRKNGLDMTFVCHHPSQLDKQVRHYLTHIAEVYNLREAWKLFGTDIRFPWPLMLLRTQAKGERKRRVRILGVPKPEYYELYDSYEIFAFDKLATSVEPQGRLFPDICKVYERKPRQSVVWPQRNRYWLDFVTPGQVPAMA